MSKVKLIYRYILNKILCKLLMVKVKYVKRERKRKLIYDGKEKIILSIKTYRDRYSTLPFTLNSLLAQTMAVDKIIVWLDEEMKENEPTPEMLKFRNYGVEYRYTDSNLKAHGKYFYALQIFKDDLVITLDDDLVYPPKLVESLVKAHEKYPNAVCARRVHRMKICNEDIAKYDDWVYEERRITVPSFDLLATGGAGTLYPPNSLSEEAFVIENIKKYCYLADDIWLKYMEMINDVPVVWVKNIMVMPPIIDGTQEKALSISNVVKRKNDEYMEIMKKLYPEVYLKMIESIKKREHKE